MVYEPLADVIVDATMENRGIATSMMAPAMGSSPSVTIPEIVPVVTAGLEALTIFILAFEVSLSSEHVTTSGCSSSSMSAIVTE